MSQEFEIFKVKQFDFDSVVINARKRLTMKGEISCRLMEHLAIAAGQEDGEDSAGRRAFKLQTPEEVVLRACDIADRLVDEFEKRGWIVEIPTYEDLPTIQKMRA